MIRNVPKPHGKNNSGLVIGCVGMMIGCAVITAIGLLILIPIIPRIGLQAVGFSEQGQTDQIFANVTPAPAVVIVDAVQPDQVVVDLGAYGSTTLEGSNQAYDTAVGSDTTGVQTALVTFDENGLYQEICRRDSTICDGTNPQYRMTRVDFRPGGAVVYADVSVSGFTQTIGAVLVANGRQFDVVGIDMNGTLYGPPGGDMSQLLEDIEMRGNDALNQLSLQAGGAQFSLTSIIVDDNNLTLVLQ